MIAGEALGSTESGLVFASAWLGADQGKQGVCPYNGFLLSRLAVVDQVRISVFAGAWLGADRGNHGVCPYKGFLLCRSGVVDQVQSLPAPGWGPTGATTACAPTRACPLGRRVVDGGPAVGCSHERRAGDRRQRESVAWSVNE
jgi:hypothetical protein